MQRDLKIIARKALATIVSSLTRTTMTLVFLYSSQLYELFSSFSYHQKYLLRQQGDVMSALNLSDKDLVTSHVATRLNGYCGGYGSLEALEDEMPKFSLPENVQKRVHGIMSRKSYH